jgi:hypothetical protein
MHRPGRDLGGFGSFASSLDLRRLPWLIFFAAAAAFVIIGIYSEHD